MADEKYVHVKCSDGDLIFTTCVNNKMDTKIFHQQTQPSTKSTIDRIKQIYPNVDENETPLPRTWSQQEKCNSIGLTQNNLRVYYKGVGKSHNDAASVRTAYSIPAACGLYYFEVKIISKGRDGYMGIGLTSQNFKMNRLPGWDKQSYGYHGDDGNSFCASGNGQPYGPTFTTGDIIGCGVNLVDNTCFYTKNGHHLGVAFKDLPAKLYPTVGLQTPGEVVDANFGQEPFKFDIEDMRKALRAATRSSIFDFPLPVNYSDWTAIFHKLVCSYLVHHGYCSTAEVFARSTEQELSEDVTSIKNRQKIIKLVMSGRMGLAIEQTIRLYPGLLENNQNLLFMLKCRQFVEMVNGSDFDCLASRPTQPPSTVDSVVQTSVIQCTKTYTNGSQQTKSGSSLIIENTANDEHLDTTNTDTNTFNSSSNNLHTTDANKINNNHSNNVEQNNVLNVAAAGDNINDVEMENGSSVSNGNSHKNGSTVEIIDTDEDMDVDPIPNSRKCTKSGVERMLEFGRELFQLSQKLEKENGANESNQKMLEDAFSLLAYSNPWSSPMGWQLCPSKRENVSAALNSAILQSMNYLWRPPAEISIAHSYELLRLMSYQSLGACAFATVEDVLQF